MGKKFNAFISGALALIGIGFAGNVQAGKVHTPTNIASVQSISEKTPLFLEKHAQSSEQSDGNLLAWHSSHVSHASHSSHVSHASHVSHQSGY